MSPSRTWVVGALAAQAVAVAALDILVNANLRIGDGTRNSINPSDGDLRQPFIMNPSGEWKKGTYSNYGWRKALWVDGAELQKDVPSAITYISMTEAKVEQSCGPDFTMERKYSLVAELKRTEHKICASKDATMVQVWGGVDDDWLGNTDTPLKYVGTYANGSFVSGTSGNAVMIRSGAEVVYFFSDFPGTTALISDCCAWGNVANHTVTNRTFSSRDSSYALYFPIGAMQAGECKEFSSSWRAMPLSADTSWTAPEVTTTTTTTTTRFEACKTQNTFDVRMCRSYMCTDCIMAWCMKQCQQLQEENPGCRCESWPAARPSYSGGEHEGEGKFGDVGDYSQGMTSP
jgi:hypothetical protein